MAKSIAKGRALYDFTGKAEMRQLTFKAGDVINITNQYDNGWWAGELNGVIGYLPATYVQLIGNATVPNTSTNGRPPSAYTAPKADGPAPSVGNRPQLGSSNSDVALPVRDSRPLLGQARPISTAPSNRPPISTPPSNPTPPPAVSRPPLPSNPTPSAVSRPPLPSNPTPSAVSRPPLPSNPTPPTPSAVSRPPFSTPSNPTPPTPSAVSRPPFSTPSNPTPTPPPFASRPPISTPPSNPTPSLGPATSGPKPTPTTRPLTSDDRGRAATLRPNANEVSDVSEADIRELDQLISKLQNDVSELKKLM